MNRARLEEIRQQAEGYRLQSPPSAVIAQLQADSLQLLAYIEAQEKLIECMARGLEPVHGIEPEEQWQEIMAGREAHRHWKEERDAKTPS